MHQIGEVAERVGLSLRTVRYYEEMGLIPPQQRTGGGFRLYTDENIERLLLIKQMKPLGFSVQASWSTPLNASTGTRVAKLERRPSASPARILRILISSGRGGETYSYVRYMVSALRPLRR